MKRRSGLQTAPHEYQKRKKASPASDPSGRESPVSDAPDQAAVGSSYTGQLWSPAGPEIVVHEAEGTEESFRSTEKEPERATIYQNVENVHGSPSSRQDGPKPPSAPRRPQSNVEGSFVPNEIPYILQILFAVKGCPNSELPEERFVVLHKPESYQEIEQVADKNAKVLSPKSVGSKELKFFYGNCTIISDNGTRIRLPLRSPDDWTRINKHIVDYWSSHTHERLHLRISRHYLASQEQPGQGNSFAKVKCWEIGDLMKTTWEEKRYIPHNVLETVISDHTIELIIKEKPPGSVPQDELYAFIHQVQAECRILLAMCVYVRLKMECLKKLLDSGWKDSRLPLNEGSQCHEDCRHKFGSLLQAQGGFRAARFVEGEHQTFHSHTVVPLHFYPKVCGRNKLGSQDTEAFHPLAVRDSDKPLDSPSEDKATGTAALRDAAWCGHGAHSNVYCVKLNPNHHSLSVDLDACFALKELNIKQNLAQKFDRELAMLKVLRKYAHAHIVTHLATWTRDGRYYMLFPYAQCDLREYMKHNKFATKDAFWLLDQFHGMAEAVKLVHDLSYKGDPTVPTTSLTVIPSTSEERRTAWHHDIKPENILFFKDSPSECGMFRLSDWGSAKVNPYRTKSYNTKSPIGTLTYEPPDLTINGKTSRPSDIWSMGCVFLELLVWAVFSWTIVETFSDQRDGKRNANSETGSMIDDAFWHKVGNEYQLRPVVVTQLQCLDEELMKPGALPFKEVVEYIRRMLEIETKKRITALGLCDMLNRTIRTKSIDVESPEYSLIPTDLRSLDGMVHGDPPLSRSSGPTYAEDLKLSPSDMSPRASRHSRNSSASEMVPSHATHSRQSSNTSNLSIRERRGSHSSANSPTATEAGT